MNMQAHILAALRELFDRWEGLIASLNAEQIASPLAPSAWTPKDVIVHLWAWQQRSIARLEAAPLDQPPQFPAWFPPYDPDVEDTTHEINARLYTAFRDRPWPVVVENWRAGFLRLLELGGEVSEKNLLDASRYPWLKGHSLAFILVSSYDHHQEHYEKLLGWLEEHGKRSPEE